MFKLLPLFMIGLFGVISQGVPSSSSSSERLIEFAPGFRVWMSEEQLDEIDRSRHETNKLAVGYFDVTEFQEEVLVNKDFVQRAFPTSASKQSIVNPLLPKMLVSNIASYVENLSSFYNRYYTTTDGVKSASYLRDLMQSFVDKSGRTDANCTLYSHSWAQPSVVCRIQGQGPLADQIVVTGAHLDSINSRATPNGRAPGADDDASGVASFVEAFRVLIEAGFKPSRSIEFMAYAAEEVGLMGSQAIARQYAQQKKNVYAVYQNEMSGYVGKASTVVVLQDFVDSGLTKFVEALIGEYCEIPLERAMCGYGCSDHASWQKVGFAAACTAEAGPFGDVNPNMHTDKDTIDKLDMQLTTEFAKLCLGFLVELSLYNA